MTNTCFFPKIFPQFFYPPKFLTIRFPFAKLLRNFCKRKFNFIFFVALHFWAKKKHFAQSFAKNLIKRFWHITAMLKSELITCLKLSFAIWCIYDGRWHTTKQDLLTLTQKTCSILPTTLFKLKLEADA